MYGNNDQNITKITHYLFPGNKAIEMRHGFIPHDTSYTNMKYSTNATDSFLLAVNKVEIEWAVFAAVPE